MNYPPRFRHYFWRAFVVMIVALVPMNLALMSVGYFHPPYNLISGLVAGMIGFAFSVWRIDYANRDKERK